MAVNPSAEDEKGEESSEHREKGPALGLPTNYHTAKSFVKRSRTSTREFIMFLSITNYPIRLASSPSDIFRGRRRIPVETQKHYAIRINP